MDTVYRLSSYALFRQFLVTFFLQFFLSWFPYADKNIHNHRNIVPFFLY
ncbi:hypothetical protein SAMN04488055_1657 [Chitinophaga niabensis]|uniref:Uncharacterized protein n=1 Tax=Chitinophaga niabensis TaxID=536979 RepID=A0A1N6EJF0_9BACT|nr:hypothetical protein SAMN04488055_1657 [Chitinophaga niabensis]